MIRGPNEPSSPNAYDVYASSLLSAGGLGKDLPVRAPKEVTPEMIEAGVEAYYQVRRYRGDDQICKEQVTLIYLAMRSIAR